MLFSFASWLSPLPLFPLFPILLSLLPPLLPPPTPSVQLLSRQVDCCVYSVLSVPLRTFRVAFAVLLCRSRNCRFPGLLVQEVDCYVTCDVTCIGAVVLQWKFLVVVVLVKNAAVGNECRPALAARMIAADVRHLSLPSETRGLSNYCCCAWYYVREDKLGLSPAAYPTMVIRGPIDLYSYLGMTITAYVPWLVLLSGGRRP